MSLCSLSTIGLQILGQTGANLANLLFTIVTTSFKIALDKRAHDELSIQVGFHSIYMELLVLYLSIVNACSSRR